MKVKALKVKVNGSTVAFGLAQDRTLTTRAQGWLDRNDIRAMVALTDTRNPAWKDFSARERLVYREALARARKAYQLSPKAMAELMTAQLA